MTAVNEYWVGHELDFYNATCATISDYSSYYPCGDIYYPVTEPLEGKLFETSILVPMLAPGESTEITLLLPPRLVTPQEVAPDLLEKGYGPGIDALVTYTNGQVVQQDAVWNDINHIWFPGTQVPANNAWDELYMHAPKVTVTVGLSALRNMSVDPNHPWMQDYYYADAQDVDEFTLNDIGDVWGMVSPHP